jgi:folate-dependent phosphoribosylglycinamide formyltransferase PurN
MSEEPTEKIRVCLLVDGDKISEWQHAAVQRMVAETTAQVTVVVQNQKEESRTKWELLKRAFELREWTLVWAIRSLFAEPISMSADIRLDDCEYTADSKWINCHPKTVDGWKTEIPADIVEQVAERADIAVRFGFGFLVGDVLTELDYGVLSYHHGDFHKYRGQPAGAWEFIHGKHEAGITLQRINEQLDGGEVATMKHISIKNARTYSEIRSLLAENSEDMLATAISEIENGQANFEVIENLGTLYTIPSGVPALRFLAKELRGYIGKRRN